MALRDFIKRGEQKEGGEQLVDDKPYDVVILGSNIGGANAIRERLNGKLTDAGVPGEARAYRMVDMIESAVRGRSVHHEPDDKGKPGLVILLPEMRQELGIHKMTVSIDAEGPGGTLRGFIEDECADAGVELHVLGRDENMAEFTEGLAWSIIASADAAGDLQAPTA